MDFNLDIDTLRSLIKLMNDGGLNELELEDEGKRVHLRKGEESRAHHVVVPAMAHAAASVPSAPQPALAGAASAKAAALPPGVKEIRSPMVGTFYRASSPDAASFVEVGDKVQEDAVLCIIEAMKVMNEIKAECRGEIVKILVANSESVEYGQPLFHVKTA